MKKKQAMAFLLSATMTVGGAIPAFAAANDINGHWAEATIVRWQNQGKIGGYEDGTFKPDRTITRAEFVRLLNTVSANTFASTSDINFSDVKESDWFFADVSKAVGNKITSGFEDGTFRPSETVTRAQAAVFICNAKGLTPNEASANAFSDAANIPSWAKGAVGAAVSAGYLSGYPDGSFGADKGMTRAEAVSTLDRVLGNTPTIPADTNQGVTTPSDDTITVADGKQEGNMVWTSGGSSSKKKSSSGGGGGSSSSSSSTNTYNNVKITSQSDADKYKGGTLKGTTEIYLSSDLTFNDVTFENVEVYAQDTVKSAYIGANTAVAPAASSLEVVIYFNGTTAVNGTLNVNSNDVSDKVVIHVNATSAVKRVARTLFAKVATVIRGPVTVPNVTAEAPVSIEDGASVSTIEAKDNASITVDENSNVDTINATGDVKDIILEGNSGNPAQINVSGDAKVENIELAKDAEAAVAVRGNAEVAQVSVSDNAAANVTATGDSKVENVVASDNAAASVTASGNANVDTIAASGNAAANVTASDNANVGAVAASDNAAAKVTATGENAKVENVELSGNATGSIEVTEGATVDTVTTTSTGKTEIKGDGEGTVGKIEAADESTVEKDENVETPIDSITPVSSVTISGASTVEVGKTISLTASVLPSDATNKTVTWSSSDTEIATVSASGVVTGVKEGSVTITAKAGTVTATKTITVKAAATSGDDKPTGNVAVTGVSLDKAEATVAIGETVKLTATVAPSNATNKTVTWTSSDEEVATVENGVVTGVAKGEVTITATAGGKSATCTVTVEEAVETPKVPVSFELSQQSIKLAKKEAENTTYDLSTITATVKYDDNSTGSGTVTWALKDGEELPAGVTFTDDKTITITPDIAANKTLVFVATLTGDDATGVDTQELEVVISATPAAYDGVSITTDSKTENVEPDGTVVLKAYKVADADASMKEELSSSDVTYDVTIKDMTSGTAGTDLTTSKDNFCSIDDNTLTIKADGFTEDITKVQITVTATADVDGEKTSEDSVVITARAASVADTLTLTAPADNAEIQQGATGTLTGTLKSQHNEAITGTINWTVNPDGAVTFTGGNTTTVGTDGVVSKEFTVSESAAKGDVIITGTVNGVTPEVKVTKTIKVTEKQQATPLSAATVTLAPNTTAGGLTATVTDSANTALAAQIKEYKVSIWGNDVTDTEGATAITTVTVEKGKTTVDIPLEESKIVEGTSYRATVVVVATDNNTQYSNSPESALSSAATAASATSETQAPTSNLNVSVAAGTAVGDIKITSSDTTTGVSYKYAFDNAEVTGLQANAEVPSGATTLSDKSTGDNVSLSDSTGKIGSWVTLYAYKEDDNNKEIVVSYGSVQITNDMVNKPTAATGITLGTDGKVSAYAAPDTGLKVYVVKSSDIQNGAITADKFTNEIIAENQEITLESGAGYKLVTVHEASGAYAIGDDEITAVAADDGEITAAAEVDDEDITAEEPEEEI